MNFEAGRRVSVRAIDDAGLPVVHYGTVAGGARGHADIDGDAHHHDRAIERSQASTISVILDGADSAISVNVDAVRPVSITSIELRLVGVDLADTPGLRQGLAAMWRAEIDKAGVTMLTMYPLGAGLRDGSDTWALAEVADDEDTYIVRVHTDPNEPNTVTVRADRSNRWDW